MGEISDCLSDWSIGTLIDSKRENPPKSKLPLPVGDITAKQNIDKSLALASMARDDPPASRTAAAMRGKVGSEFET